MYRLTALLLAILLLPVSAKSWWIVSRVTNNAPAATLETIGETEVADFIATEINDNSKFTLWPLAGVYNGDHNSVVTYTFSGRENSGLTRSVRIALYTESAGTYTIVPGSDTGKVFYTCASNFDDVDIVSSSVVSISAGVQYHVGFTFSGWGSMAINTTALSDGVYGHTIASIENDMPTTDTITGTITGWAPQKLLLTAN